MPNIIGYISGSAKHHHKIHVLVEIGPRCEMPDEHAGGEYEVSWAITACGIDTRTKSKHRWRALVLGPLKGDEGFVCAHCMRRMKK